MWLLNWLPDFVFHGMLVVGLLALVASFVLGFIPFVSQYKLPIQVAGIILTVLAVWYEGGIAKDAEYKARIAEMELKISRAETATAEANNQLSKILADKDKEIALVQAELKNRIKAGAAAMDAVCKIPSDVVAILNDAAKKGAKK